jgi:hypothetical protein
MAAAQYIEHVDNFNRALKELTKNLSEKYPRDATIARAKQRIFLAVQLSPVQVVEKVGKNLFNYKDQIYNLTSGSEDFFMENDFDVEIKTAVGKDADKADMVQYIIPKIKECARSLPAEEKTKYKEMVVDMLDEYIEYMTTRPERGKK